MNVIQNNINAGKRNIAGRKPMVVKPTVIRNALMPPPFGVLKKYTTPSSSRSENKDAGQNSTPHTKSTPTIRRETHIIMSICEGRGKASCIVGIAAVDIHRPVIILSQILDTKTYSATLAKINVLSPVELLVPTSFIEGATQNRLVTLIVAQFPNLTVNAIPRSEYNRGRGLHMLKTMCAGAFSSVILQIDIKFYSLAASCALLRYVEQSRRVIYSPKTVKVEYQEPEHTTAIDIDTANLLELTSCSGKQNVSLFTVLNYCSTIPGKKLLRTNILQPPCRKDLIETRLDCVQELLENPNLLTRLQETLKPLSDIESALTFGTVLPSAADTVSERQLNYSLQLKGLLMAVQPLAEELKGTKHPVFRYIYNRIEGLDIRRKILTLISEVINEDAHLAKGQAGELQRCFAIKSGINGFLDLSRRLYTEGVDAMRAYVDELTEKYNLPLRVHHTIKNGFHIILPLTKALRTLKKDDLPQIFTKVERFSSQFYLTTMDMINFDKRLKNNSCEIQNISNVLIYQLLVSIRPFIGDLYNLCEDVGQLDMLVSLARVSSLPNWVRPKLVDCYMNLEGARHPILEHVADQEPIANSIYAYPRLRLHIITGPNMSGKSILLHSISLIQILFQLGCYVPCTSASLRVCDRVYARVSDNDPQVTLQASSFAVEMEKMEYLLSTVQESSLVLVDEMCKTTGCDEAVPLSMAICERLLKVGCFTFIATHYGALTVLEDMYPNVANWHLETLEEMRANNTRISLKFTYKLLPGITTIEGYGIKLSRVFNSSKSISDRAEALYNWLLPSRKSLVSGNTVKTAEFQKYKLQSELDMLKIKNQLTDEIQKDLIENFQQKTGLSFQPSLISTRSSEITNQSFSKKSSSSSDKKNSSVPTPKTNTTSSNHEFSVPGSSKISDKDNIFGDQNDDESCQYADVWFNSDISSIHKISDTQKSVPKNYFFNAAAFLPKQDSDFSSAKNTMFARSSKSVNVIVDATPSCKENNQMKNVSVSSYENIMNQSNFNESSQDIFKVNSENDPELNNLSAMINKSLDSDNLSVKSTFSDNINKSISSNNLIRNSEDIFKVNSEIDPELNYLSSMINKSLNSDNLSVKPTFSTNINKSISSNNVTRNSQDIFKVNSEIDPELNNLSSMINKSLNSDNLSVKPTFSTNINKSISSNNVTKNSQDIFKVNSEIDPELNNLSSMINKSLNSDNLSVKPTFSTNINKSISSNNVIRNSQDMFKVNSEIDPELNNLSSMINKSLNSDNLSVKPTFSTNINKSISSNNVTRNSQDIFKVNSEIDPELNNLSSMINKSLNSDNLSVKPTFSTNINKSISSNNVIRNSQDMFKVNSEIDPELNNLSSMINKSLNSDNLSVKPTHSTNINKSISSNDLIRNSQDIFKVNSEIDPELNNVTNVSSITNNSLSKFGTNIDKNSPTNSQEIVPYTHKFNSKPDTSVKNISNRSSTEPNVTKNSEEISFSSANNTMFNNKSKNFRNLTVSSTPINSEKSVENTPISLSSVKSEVCEKYFSMLSSYNTVYSHLPITASVNSVQFQNEENNTSFSSSMLNKSSPILNKKVPKKPNQIKLVSNLYDSETSSDNSVIEVVEIYSDDSIIIHNKDDSDICSPDELNFSSYLNLKQGITSTPVKSKDLSTTQYFTVNSNDNSSGNFQSPVKRKPTLPASGLPQKFKKILSPLESSTTICDTSFGTCENSSNSLQQIVTKYPFVNLDDNIFDEDSVRLSTSDSD